MSRRCHHGSPRHAHVGRGPRRAASAAAAPDRPLASTAAAPPEEIVSGSFAVTTPAEPDQPDQPDQSAPAPEIDARAGVPAGGPDDAGATGAVPARPVRQDRAERPAPAERTAPPAQASERRPAERHRNPAQGNGNQQPDHREQPAERGATGPQLRRFIKSRAYVPMHELRRRFVINGADDDVTPVDLGERRRVFVGLPEREGKLLGELLRGGDIGYELSLDPISPIVVGVYPMRPVTRA